MSKRFTSSEKWGDPWYRKLSPVNKCLWDWLFCNCDIAGSIDPDLDLASFQIGEAVDSKSLSAFGDRILKMKSGRLWLTKFIEFQYGILTPTCPAHRPVAKTIDRLSIPYALSTEWDTILKRKGSNTQQEKEKEKEKEKDSSLKQEVVQDAEKEHEVVKGQSPFERFWSAYPRKVGKGSASAAWKLVKRPAETLQSILTALEWQKVSDQWTKNQGQYIPHPATYLRQERWLDEMPTTNEAGDAIPPETEEHRRIRLELELRRAHDDDPNWKPEDGEVSNHDDF